MFHGPTPNNCPCGSELRQDTPPPPTPDILFDPPRARVSPFRSPPKTHPHPHPPPLHLAARATTDPAARPERLPGDPTPSFLPSIRRGKARSPSPAHRDVHGSPHRAQRPCRPIPSSPGRPCPPRPPSKIPHPLSPPPPPPAALFASVFFLFRAPSPLSRFPLFFWLPSLSVLACVRWVHGRRREGRGGAAEEPPLLPSPPFPPLEGGPGPGTRVVFCFVFFVFPRRGGKEGKGKGKGCQVRASPPPPPPSVRGREEEKGGGGGRGC